MAQTVTHHQRITERNFDVDTKKALLFSGRAGQAQLWKEKAAREAASAPAQAVIRGEETP